MSCLVVNLFAGPGSGKSTTCAGIFERLKLRGINCEMALEYAKDKVWEESFHTLDNQIYVFGKQLHRIFRLKDKVDVIITDSPLPFSILYDKSKSENFKRLVLEQFNQFNNLNIFIERDENYNTSGRMQTQEEARKLDNEIKYILEDNHINYTCFKKGETDIIVDNILKHLNK
jgi:thymidylate kinase